MHIGRLRSLLIEKSLFEFPEAQAIVLWGGVLKRASDAMKHGDIDVLVVVPFEQDDPEQEAFIRSKLALLVAEFRQDHGIELDPAATSRKQLCIEPLPLLLVNGPYKANSVVQYLLKNESTVIYGDADVLGVIPQITLGDALADLSGLVLRRIGEIRAELRPPNNRERVSGTTSAASAASAQLLVKRYWSSFVVFARTVFSFQKGRIASKVQALEYVGKHYPEHARLMQLLGSIYKDKELAASIRPGIGSDLAETHNDVTEEDVGRFLDLVQHVVDRDTRS